MTYGVGIVGSGVISHAYAGTVARAPELDLVAHASRSMTSARRQAACYGGTAMPLEDMLVDPRIAIVVNLTPPALHHRIGRKVIEAGKHLYNEKPFATTMDDALDLLTLADARGVRVGCAPDTFLAPAHVAARRILAEGRIGDATHGQAVFAAAGPEHWHPDPAPFYAAGGGPLLDIGPYYLTLLVSLLGPIAEVVAIGHSPQPYRVAADGRHLPVAVFTTITGALSFVNGAIVSLSLSWDTPGERLSRITLHGPRGSLHTADPNGFTGAVRWCGHDGAWRQVDEAPPPRRLDAATIAAAVAALGRGVDPLTGAPADPTTPLRLGDRRGMGVRDLATAIDTGREPIANGHLAAHVLEGLLALDQSAREGRRIAIASRVPRPRPAPEFVDV